MSFLEVHDIIGGIEILTFRLLNLVPLFLSSHQFLSNQLRRLRLLNI